MSGSGDLCINNSYSDLKFRVFSLVKQAAIDADAGFNWSFFFSFCVDFNCISEVIYPMKLRTAVCLMYDIILKSI